MKNADAAAGQLRRLVLSRLMGGVVAAALVVMAARIFVLRRAASLGEALGFALLFYAGSVLWTRPFRVSRQDNARPPDSTL